jgi:hypothetical protein
MEDVNMEDEGPPVSEHTEQGASSEQHPSSTSAQTTTGQQGPHPDTIPAIREQHGATDAITSAPTTSQTNADVHVDVNVDQGLDSSKNTENTAPTASESTPTPEKSTLTTNADTIDNGENGVATPATSTAQESQKEEDSAMDVDTVPPAAVPSTAVDVGVQDHPMDSQPAEKASMSMPAQPTTSSAGEAVAGSSESQSNVEKGNPSEMSIESTLMTPATTVETVKLEGNEESVPEKVPAADASSSSTAPTHTATEGEAAGPSTTGEQPETSAAAESQTEPEALPGLPPKPVYVPQFKFTTFAPMTPIPVRNITTTFQKTDKNYVLKELAAGKQRRRKRKAEQADGEASGEAKPEGEAQENGSGAAEGESPAVGGESGILKRKRGDEFLAIRRGIFADEEENENEEEADKENQENGENGTKDANEDEESDEFSSDSDSEESVMNEMDENGETRSVSFLWHGVHESSSNRICIFTDSLSIIFHLWQTRCLVG